MLECNSMKLLTKNIASVLLGTSKKECSQSRTQFSLLFKDFQSDFFQLFLCEYTSETTASQLKLMLAEIFIH